MDKQTETKNDIDTLNKEKEQTSIDLDKRIKDIGDVICSNKDTITSMYTLDKPTDENIDNMIDSGSANTENFVHDKEPAKSNMKNCDKKVLLIKYYSNIKLPFVQNLKYFYLLKTNHGTIETLI